MHQPPTRRELLSVDDYAARTGISATEIRRQIRAGTLPAETFQRPQGTYYRVIVETLEDPPAPAEQAPDTSQEPPESRQDARDTILLAQLEALATAHERLVEAYREIGAQRERAAAAEAAANHERARADELARRLAESEAAVASERARSWWQKLIGG